ncbi:MAG TPA: hypothetical protein VEW26_04885 [Allosphingosinicella sp.]|nr:hypothetical protein [Allosphingosinicella sp.]
MLRSAACFGLSLLPAVAFAQQSPVLQPPWLADPPTSIEVAASRFADCVSREIRLLPASLETHSAAARIVGTCQAALAAVEREADRIIERSNLPEERKALARLDLRERLGEAGERIAIRVDRRRASMPATRR